MRVLNHLCIADRQHSQTAAAKVMRGVGEPPLVRNCRRVQCERMKETEKFRLSEVELRFVYKPKFNLQN